MEIAPNRLNYGTAILIYVFILIFQDGDATGAFLNVYFTKNPAIDDRAADCKETVRWSLLKYMWSFEKRVGNSLNKLKRDYPNVTFIELRTTQDVRHLMILLAPLSDRLCNND